MKDVVRAAAVQAEPVWFDAAGTTDKTIELIREAASGGAEIVALSETWIPGYPIFLHYAQVDQEIPFVAEYRANSISLDGPEMTSIRKAAADNGIMVTTGFAERAGRSLYMSQVTISATGEVLSHRRKLKPTHRERTLYGQGDGSDLQVVDTPLGKIGSLMCWEHLQPLNKMAMIGLGEQIHVASWPQLDYFGGAMMDSESTGALNRTYALECGTFVLMSTQLLSDEGRAAFNRYGVQVPEFSGGGAARIFAPDSSQLTAPLPSDKEGIVYADLQMSMIEVANYFTDPAGHYSRPDVYNLTIDITKKNAVDYVSTNARQPAAGAVEPENDAEKTAEA